MLVFRCECEHVLGVENDSSRGRAGECPACGRIIRVPPVLIDGAGKLQMAGSPSRASISGALSPIKDLRPSSAAAVPVVAKPEAAASATNSTRASDLVAQVSPSTNASTKVKTAAETSDTSSETLLMEAETLSPLTENEAAEAADMIMPELPDAAPARTPVSVVEKDAGALGKKQKGGIKVKAANDPALAVETRIDKNIGTLASAAASSRRRKGVAESAPAAKKAPVMLYVVVIVLLLLVIGALYAFGIIGGSGTKATKTIPSAPPVTGAKPDDKKTPENVTPPDSTKPVEEKKSDAAVPKDDAAKKDDVAK